MRASNFFPWREPWRLTIRASAIALWKEARSRPGNYGVYCGAPGCRERLGTGVPYQTVEIPTRRLLDLVVEAGFDDGEDGFWRYSRESSARHPFRRRQLKQFQTPQELRDIQTSGGAWTNLGKGIASKGQQSKKTGHYAGFEHVGRGRIAAKTQHVIYMICRDPKCGARNLVVPHLDVVSFPTEEILNGPCGHCPACVAHDSECAHGDCGGCYQGWESRRAGTAIRNPSTGYLY